MNRVVVTGMGAVTPIGNDLDSFWENLKSGKSGINLLTRFDANATKVKVAAEIKDFDPFLYMDKNDVRKNDLYAVYALAAASQAVDQSKIFGAVDPFRAGTYFGSGIGGIETFEREHSVLLEKGERRVSPFFIPMLISNIASGIISIKYNFQGAALPVTTACATGNNAIGEAYRAIKHGYLDAAVAGGAEAAITPIGIAGFSNMKALSTTPDPRTACRPFDAQRNGFVMGEGAGALVLESYDHAVGRGAEIYGEICGYGVTCDAYHITAPQPDGIGGAMALRSAYAESGVTPDFSRVYINAHGTSTPMNDSIETLAIKRAFGTDNAKRLMVSSTKSMTGHMLGAAGAVEAIACIMAIKHGIIPPTIGYRYKDENCDLDYVTNSARAVSPELALSSSLGFGGHNACLAFKRINSL